ncbi:TetR/AcrR family transcriptional regulator [Streptomyces johnsoniae]|uniref:Helix-turn-helix domain-containing protein n=1 Tax=Streptomyces johnsoniae TaxID=3075532 RepID=A0ABU2S2E4_9ACTN|nr:helix-turn-helix domain-containing protein [Streptomyces sp. DSM 41886]MDT0443110.1 helix-turn-helix domain-containing protein [Streptomyces sp. DSM 41886]
MPRAEGSRRGQLPVVGAELPERADAARNRRKILAAVRTLAASRGLDSISFDEVATAAGVGVGTVYRRFGDKSGLAYALLDDSERALQTAFLQGPPPLGPGAPPRERITAFLHAYLDRLLAETDLLLAAETGAPTGRHTGAYAAHRAHLAGLAAQARPDADAGYLADALLAPLAAPLIVHQTRDLGMDRDRIRSGLDTLARALIPG